MDELIITYISTIFKVNIANTNKIVYNKNRRKPIKRLTPVKIMVFTRGTPIATVFSFPLIIFIFCLLKSKLSYIIKIEGSLLNGLLLGKKFYSRIASLHRCFFYSPLRKNYFFFLRSIYLIISNEILSITPIR